MTKGHDTTAQDTTVLPLIDGHDERKPTDPKEVPSETERRIQERVWEKVFNRAAPVARMGRFTILGEIGRGGMGTVYTAYDESLDRKVAIKVLQATRSSPDDQARFHREARALARLSHPNVVTIHEVGHTDDKQLYLAMEFIHGHNLRDWLCTKPDWREVLETFLQAGRGLSAAHEAHLVHRDLKPHNMMRSFEGVVKILDFGLVRTDRGQASELEQESQGHSQLDLATSDLSKTLTMPGMLLGTPAYMAPEQLRGEIADASSDQFSFCVALYEGLYGYRPYEGKRLDQLLLAIEQDGVAPIPSDSPVPAAIHTALLRGLSVEPADRWPSMTHLLEALAHDPPRRGRGWVLAAAAAASLVGGAWWMGSQAEATPCADASAHLAGVWDAQRRTEVKHSFADLSVPYAQTAWTWANEMLDEYADDWVEMHTDACQANAVRREQSSQMLDLRMACLHRASIELQATVDVLASADAEVAERVPEVIGSLWPLSRCADLTGLQADVPPPEPAEAETVDEARRLLARADRMMAAGRLPAARKLLDEASSLLQELRYAPIQTEYKFLEGLLLGETGDLEGEEARLIEVLQLSLRGRQRRTMVRALRELIRSVGSSQMKPAEARRYWPMLEELTRDEPEYQADMHHSLGVLLIMEGDAQGAEEQFRRAVLGEEETNGPDQPSVMASRENLAIALRRQLKYTEAETELRALLLSVEKTLGSSHPQAGLLRTQLVDVLNYQQRYKEAEREGRVALSVLIAAYGSEHPHVAMARTNLAMVLESQGEHARAEEQLRTALLIKRKHFGPDSARLAITHYNLISALDGQGRLHEAEQEARRALALWLDAHGPAHPSVARARHGIALLLIAREEYAEAVQLLRETEAQLSAEETYIISYVRMDLSGALAKSGRWSEALPFAEQAWHGFDREDVRLDERAQAAFTLASILWDVDGAQRDRVRAVRLATDAARWFRESRSVDAELARVERWLETHSL